MTIYDIAEDLGVSAATVSLALNGDRRVAERTRERVVSYAARNGFKRNEQARNFRLKRTCNVAIVVHNIDNDFWYGVVKAVEETLGEAYNVILCNTEGDPGKEEKIARSCFSNWCMTGFRSYRWRRRVVRNSPSSKETITVSPGR